jgi:hypothetical protein
VKSAVAADDLLKTIVRDNMGSAAPDYRGQYGRQLTTALFAIQANLTQAQLVSKDFAWRPMFPVLQEIAQASTQAGTYLCFDVVAIVAGLLNLEPTSISAGWITAGRAVITRSSWTRKWVTSPTLCRPTITARGLALSIAPGKAPG